VGVLILAQYGYDGTPNSDADEAQIYLMLFLAFPSSLVALTLGGIVALCLESLGAPLGATSRLELLSVWIVFFVAGCLQWFVVIPLAWSKWKSWRNSRLTHDGG
jgi:hypothetical protein